MGDNMATEFVEKAAIHLMAALVGRGGLGYENAASNAVDAAVELEKALLKYDQKVEKEEKKKKDVEQKKMEKEREKEERILLEKERARTKAKFLSLKEKKVEETTLKDLKENDTIRFTDSKGSLAFLDGIFRVDFKEEKGQVWVYSCYGYTEEGREISSACFLPGAVMERVV